MKNFIISFALFIVSVNHHALSQNVLTKILTDSIRYITATGETGKFYWIGTNNGLYRENKQNGRVWTLTKINSKLPDNYITCIACFANGQTYIGTKKGILYWDNFGFFLYTTDNSGLPENHISSMTLDNNENLWIRTPHCGLLKAIGHCIKIFKLKKVDQ